MHGVDISAQMLRLAETKLADIQDPAVRDSITYEFADIRTLDVEASFDSVVSLFHVMSYQTTDDDLSQAFSSAARALKPGGIFLFDFWHGPGVLEDPPYRRKKEIEKDGKRLRREAIPNINHDTNVVEICFDVSVEGEDSQPLFAFSEDHHMRYFFAAEIDRFLKEAGFTLIKTNAWLTDNPATSSAWYACAVCVKT